MQETNGGYSYYDIITKLSNNQYDISELSTFVEKLYKIGESYIRYSYHRIKKIITPFHNTPESLARDAIAQFFLRANYNNHFIIIDLINNWNPPIKSEKDALFFLNKVISNRIEQHISLKLRESDPLFSKILDSINYLIRNESYNKINYLGKVYITEAQKSKINWIVIDEDDFQKIPSYLFFERKMLLKSLFNYLKTETTYFPAIPLNELIFRLKRINLFEYLNNNSVDNLVEQIEMKESLNTGLNYIQGKLRTSYLDKDKLDNEEYRCFNEALQTLATDIANGGTYANLYSYLSLHFENLSKETYLHNYHNIFEYLVKLFKNKIAEEISVSGKAILILWEVLSLYYILMEYI